MKGVGFIATSGSSAACLLDTTQVLAAAREERFSRVPEDARFPVGALAYCMEEGALQSESEIDFVTCYDTSDAGATFNEIIRRLLPDFTGHVRYTRDAFPVDHRTSAPLGPSYTSAEIRDILDRFDLPYHCIDPDDAASRVAEIAADGKRVGVLRGRMEFGSSTSGHRAVFSIGSSRNDRPNEGTFAASVVAATGHVPVLAEPFRPPGEPIICSPMDAYRGMMIASLDCIVMEDVLVWRLEQPGW